MVYGEYIPIIIDLVMGIFCDADSMHGIMAWGMAHRMKQKFRIDRTVCELYRICSEVLNRGHYSQHRYKTKSLTMSLCLEEDGYVC